MAGLWDFFAPALCPLVTDYKLSDHTHLLSPAADFLEPYTSRMGVPKGSEYRLIAPLFLGFGTAFIASYIVWGVLGVKGPARCGADKPGLRARFCSGRFFFMAKLGHPACITDLERDAFG
jgi:quinol-cytochrome oxidoreductase complex cytochrome b subunit